MKKTLYDVLHVSSKAEPEMIETAYRMRSEKLNDAIESDAQNEMKLVRQAYAILSDPAKRAMYDQSILAATSGNRVQIYADGMVEENRNEGHGILKWGIAAAVIIAAVFIVLNYYRDSKKIEADAQNISKHLDNEQELVSGVVNNQSKAIDNSYTVSSRTLDLSQEQALHRRLAEERRLEEMNRQRESQMENARKTQENARRQQEELQAARQEEASKEQYRQNMMNKMISMKEWDLARSFAKSSYEFSNINQMEQADKRNKEQAYNQNAIIILSTPDASPSYSYRPRAHR